MIFYLVTARHRYAIELFLQLWAPEVRSVMTVVPYERVAEHLTPRAGTYIFTDLERLTPTQDRIAHDLLRRLSEMPPDEVRVLNSPELALRRYELLHRLHEEGVNDYRAYRLREMREPPRWPVFIKPEHGHGGRRVELLGSQTDFELEVVKRRLMGRDLDGSLVVEFCDTRRPGETTFHKHSAFVMGERVIPRHLFRSHEWVVKHASLVAAPEIEEELAYLDANPHEEQILNVARIGGFGYGRIDYSMLGDRIQVWEFNTNPVIFSPYEHFHAERIPTQEMVAVRIARGFLSLDARGPSCGEAPMPQFPAHPLAGASKLRHAFRRVSWIRRLWLLGRRAKNTAKGSLEAVATLLARILRPWMMRRLEKSLWE